MAIKNEQTIQNIYNCEVAANLLRKYLVTQEMATANANIVTLILTATAIQDLMIKTPNWSNLP